MSHPYITHPATKKIWVIREGTGKVLAESHNQEDAQLIVSALNVQFYEFKKVTSEEKE